MECEYEWLDGDLTPETATDAEWGDRHICRLESYHEGAHECGCLATR